MSHKILFASLFLTVLTACGGGSSSDDEVPDAGLTDNQAPTVTGTENVEFVFTDNPQLSLIIDDPEDDPLSVAWSVVERPTDGDLSIEIQDDAMGVRLGATVPGRYRIRAQVYDGTHVVYHDATVTVINRAPEFGSFAWSSDTPSQYDSVSVRVRDFLDPEGVFLTINYVWQVNGVVAEDQNWSFLYRDQYVKGDSVSVYAILSDGVNETRTETLTTEVHNALPQFSSTLTLSPETPDIHSDITASMSYLYDLDEDPLTVTYDWNVNGVPVTAVTGPTLEAQYTGNSDADISVVARVSDGEIELSTNPAAVSIEGPTVELVVTGLPDEIQHGELLQFNVETVAGSTETVELAYGPAGMAIDENGAVSWVPNELMLLPRETIRFGFKVSNDDDILSRLSIALVDADRAIPVARSSVVPPANEQSIQVGDYDADGDQEMLVSVGDGHIYTIAFDGESYEQEWLYPFGLPTNGVVRQMLSADLAGDGVPDVFAVASDGISIISDLQRPAELIYAPEAGFSLTRIVSAVVANIDADPQLEMVVLEENPARITVMQAPDWSVEFVVNLTGDHHEELVVANLDDDPALELVTETGHVIDGETGANEWFYNPGFGARVAVGDINGDGTGEIIGFEPRYGLEPEGIVYSVALQSELWRFAFQGRQYPCTISMENIDEDIQIELLLGYCSTGHVVAYDGSTQDMVEQQRWNALRSNPESLTVGDVDNDDELEVVWGMGDYSNYALAVASVADLDSDIAYIEDEFVYDHVVAAGVAQVTPEQQSAFFALSGEEPGSGQRLAALSESGDVVLGEGMALGSGREFEHALLVDYDRDGYDEVFAANDEGTVFAVHQLNDNNLEFSIGDASAYRDRFKKVLAADVTEDNIDDAVLVNGNQIVIHDVSSNRIVWTSEGFSGVRDLAILANDEGRPNLVMAAGDRLSLLTWSEGGYVQTRSVDGSCQQLQVGPLDQSGAQRVICVLERSYRSQTYFSVYNQALDEVASYAVPYRVRDFMVDATDHENPNLLLITAVDAGYSYNSRKTSIISVSPSNGEVVWESAPLVGRPTGLKLLPGIEGERRQLMLSTERAMFLTR